MRFDQIFISGLAGSRDGLPLPSHFPSRETRRLGGLGCLALGCAEAAIGAARLPPEILEHAALAFGSDLGDIDQIARFLEVTRGPDAFQSAVHSAAPGELARLLGIRGPQLVLSSGRASGAVAVLTGALALINQRCSVCLCVAADLSGAVVERALSAAGWPADSFGAAAAAIVLETGSSLTTRGARGQAQLLSVAPHAAVGQPWKRRQSGAMDLCSLVDALERGEAAVSPTVFEVVRC